MDQDSRYGDGLSELLTWNRVVAAVVVEYLAVLVLQAQSIWARCRHEQSARPSLVANHPHCSEVVAPHPAIPAVLTGG